ncbi:SH3 domain-containing protein [uncultured Helicobacter sp.]|uniref:SH3 domain-containing protein n=1 Tax=uncultured Helicobacter sp. TaxID=175537 RepID=UPI00261C24FF|nr:SH3 domain-containing protein [uncultured Helicobacter sp.]
MLESLKKILKVYPLPIFVLLLTFVIYYSAFELLKKKESLQTPISEEESMQSIIETPKEIAREIPKEAQQSPLEAPLATPQQLPEQKPISHLTSRVKSLNIRKDTNTQSHIVGKLTPAQTAISLEERDGWILLADSSTKEPIGWALKRFVKETTTPAMESNINPNITEAPQTMESKMDSNITEASQALYASKVPSLNIRENPSTEARILNKLTPNDAVSIIETNGIWVKIQDSTANGKNGWVVKRSLILRD